MLKKLIQPLLGQRAPELMAATVAINVLALGSSLYSIHLLNRYVTIGLTPTLVTLTLGVLVAIAFEVALRKQRQRVLEDITRSEDEAVSERVFKAFVASRYEALGLLPLPAKREALAAPAAMQQLGSTANLGALLDLPFAVLITYSLFSGVPVELEEAAWVFGCNNWQGRGESKGRPYKR
jgi:ATP-binding cassette subfamily C protein LapB